MLFISCIAEGMKNKAYLKFFVIFLISCRFPDFRLLIKHKFSFTLFAVTERVREYNVRLE